MFPGITALAQQVITGANYFRGSLNQTLTEVTQRTLTELRQVSSSDPKLRSTLQRLGLGRTLEGLNSAMFRTFSLAWRYAMTQMTSQLMTQSTPGLAWYDGAFQASKAVVSDILGSAFQAMYQSLIDHRLELMLGAGLMNKSKLTRTELLRLKACTDNEGLESFYPANLLGLLGEVTDEKSNSLFEDFLIDLTQFLKGHRQGEQSLLSLPPVAGQEQFMQTIPETTEEPLAEEITAGLLTTKDKQLFLKILNDDKALFIDDVRQLHLRTVGNVVGGVPLDDTTSNPLFKPSAFLDILKNPGKYQSILGTADRSLTRADTALQDPFPLPLEVVSLTPQGKQITSRFDVTAKKITGQTLGRIQRLLPDHSELAHLEQRVLIGDTLNKLNRQLGKQLINSFEQFRQPATGERAESSTQENSAGDEQLIAIFQTMYATLVRERQQLFLAAGYFGQGKLSRDEVLQLRSGAYNQEGKPVFTPVHLIKAINNNLSTRREHDRFDLFLLKLSHLPVGSGKSKILREGYQKIKDEKPVLVSGYDRTASLQRMNTILDREKGLFIDQVKGLQLRDNEHFGADIPLDEERKRLLFQGGGLLDVVRYPDAYRLRISQKEDPVADAESARETEPRRMRREAGLPPVTSSAARPRGVLESVLFGTLGGLFASARTTARPALSGSADEHQDQGTVRPLNHSIPLDSKGNLVLAALFAAKFNDRQLTSKRTGAATLGNQDMLAKSPGFQLVSDSLLISDRLQMEVTAFIRHLDDNDAIDVSWDLGDLVNMSILKATPKTSTRVTETFLCEVLRSPHIGLAHERPENIFTADGRVRGRPGDENDLAIFFNPETGKTAAGGPAMGLAKAMLQALARARLAKYPGYALPRAMHRTIVRQTDALTQQQASGYWQTAMAKSVTIPDIVDTLDARLADGGSIFPEAQSLDPVTNIMSRGRYDQGEKLFMQLSAVQQFDRVAALAGETDYLGLDYSAEPLEQLRAQMLARERHGHKVPRWQLLQFSQQAWQLFANLYDSKFAAPAEAINRIKMATMLNRGLIGADEARQLGQLILKLLPRRTSASDYVALKQADRQADALTPVQLHQFDPEQIAGMISSYEALRSYTGEHFAEVFGDSIGTPELREELISFVAQTSLDRLRGSLLSGPWRSVVSQVLRDEFKEFFQGQDETKEVSQEAG